MKKLLTVICGLTAAVSTAATPAVSNVAFSQDPENRLVTVTYDLSGADGIVIAEFLTNGVSIGWANMRNMIGAVNRTVSVGEGNEILWRPDRDWQEGGKIVSGTLSARVYAYPTNSPPDYMALEISGTKARYYYPCEDALPEGIGSRRYRTEIMLFRRIPAANRTFTVGAPKWETGFELREGAYTVTLTNDFYLGVFPVTQAQYMNIMHAEHANPEYANPTNPSTNSGADADICPANNLSGTRLGIPYSAKTSISDIAVDAHQLIQRARAITGINKIYLPTRAEWQFACRAGSPEPVYGGYSLDDVAWYADNSGGTLHPVGLKKPNAFGLYDMLGNVAERVRDSAAGVYFTGEHVAPFYGTNSHGGFQAMCGGYFGSSADEVRVAKWTDGSNAAAEELDGVYYTAHNQSYYHCSYGARLSIALE